MARPDFRSIGPGIATRIDVAAADGARLALYDFGPPAGRPDAPALLVGHANGFAAGSYEPLLSALSHRLHVFALDARGHGGSAWPAGPLDEVFALGRFADDLARLDAAATRIAGRVPHYVGHSLNAVAALRLMITGRAPAWPTVTLFEPALFPTPDVAEHAEAVEKHGRLVRRTLGRRATWPSVEAYRDFLQDRGIFAGLDPAMLAAHCAATLAPLPDGGFTLASPPAVEAAIFDTHADDTTWHGLDRLRDGAARDRLLLVSGDPTRTPRDWVTAVMSAMAARAGARLHEMAGAGHLMLLEQPRLCHDLVLARVERPAR